MDLQALLERAARLFPRREAVVDGARRLSYGEVHARVEALAAYLAARGVRAGERVSILAWNGLEFLEAYFACAALGAISNPMNVRLVAREQADVLRDAGSRWLVADARFAELVNATLREETALETVLWIGSAPASEAPMGLNVRSDAYEAVLDAHRGHAFERVRCRGEDVAHLYYTSGTTGRPKGVMLTHRNVTTHALATLAELSLSERDTWAHIAPMFHLADAWATFAITWAGGRHVMMPRFESEAALALLVRERVTITNLVPTMLNLMVKQPGARGRDYASLRVILSGGAPIAPEVVRSILDTFGCDYVQTYGMTETSPFLTFSLLKEHLKLLPRDQQIAYKCKTGRAFAAVELRVVGEDGHDVAQDEQAVGEIRVRGETVTPGYWNRPEETRAAFEDGWLKTGDLALIDPEGYVSIVDRKKDMINTGGEKVYTTEVESVLYAHPAVLEAAVYAAPDATWGERVCAAIVLRAGASAAAADIESFCRDRLAGFKVPRTIHFLPELPRTGSGKILKRALRDAESPSC